MCGNSLIIKVIWREAFQPNKKPSFNQPSDLKLKEGNSFLVEMRGIEPLSETSSSGTISGCSQYLNYSNSRVIC